MRPLGLISLNQGSFCVSFENWMPVALYGRLQVLISLKFWMLDLEHGGYTLILPM